MNKKIFTKRYFDFYKSATLDAIDYINNNYSDENINYKLIVSKYIILKYESIFNINSLKNLSSDIQIYISSKSTSIDEIVNNFISNDIFYNSFSNYSNKDLNKKFDNHIRNLKLIKLNNL